MNATFLIPLVAFVSVSLLVGVLAFVLRDNTPKTVSRLDTLIGKRRREDDEKADILRRSAFEGDKQSFVEMMTPKFFNLQRLFEQADCHIKPGTLSAISLMLALLGFTLSVLTRIPLIFAPLNALLLFSIPWLWLWNKRRVRLAKFASQLSDALELVARALRSGHSLASGMHVVAEEMPSPI